MNTSLTDDFLPKRNVFQRLSDGSAEEVQSLPSSSPVGLNTLNDSKEGKLKGKSRSFISL